MNRIQVNTLGWAILFIIPLCWSCEPSSCKIKKQTIYYGGEARSLFDNRTIPTIKENYYNEEGLLTKEVFRSSNQLTVKLYSKTGKLLTKIRTREENDSCFLIENKYNQWDSLVYQAKDDCYNEPHFVKKIRFHENGVRAHLEVVEKKKLVLDGDTVYQKTIEYDTQGRLIKKMVTGERERSSYLNEKTECSYFEKEGHLQKKYVLDLDTGDSLEVERYDSLGHLIYRATLGEYRWYDWPDRFFWKYDGANLMRYVEMEPKYTGAYYVSDKHLYRFENGQLQSGMRMEIDSVGMEEEYFAFSLERDEQGRVVNRWEIGAPKSTKNFLLGLLGVDASEAGHELQITYHDNGFEMKSFEGGILVGSLEANEARTKLRVYRDSTDLQAFTLYENSMELRKKLLDYLTTVEAFEALGYSMYLLKEEPKKQSAYLTDGQVQKIYQYENGKTVRNESYQSGALSSLWLHEYPFDSVEWTRAISFFHPDEVPEGARLYSDTSDLMLSFQGGMYEILPEDKRDDIQRKQVGSERFDKASNTYKEKIERVYNDKHQVVTEFYEQGTAQYQYDQWGHMVLMERIDLDGNVHYSKSYDYNSCGHLTRAQLTNQRGTFTSKVKYKYW